MPADLHALLRRRKLAVFVDLKVMTRALRARTPVAVARRQAEYVLIDNLRVPLGFDEERFLAHHLAHVHSVRNGLGYSGGRKARAPATPLHLPFHLPHPSGGALEPRRALRRQARAEASS